MPEAVESGWSGRRWPSSTRGSETQTQAEQTARKDVILERKGREKPAKIEAEWEWEWEWGVLCTVQEWGTASVWSLDLRATSSPG